MSSVTLPRILNLWWPLACSWALMGAEQPLFTAVVARMAESDTNLAAFGSLVFPLCLLVEAPIIMLLAASTALCKDHASYLQLRRFTHVAGITLTAIHVAVAFSPLYYFVAETVIRVPPEAVEPGRVGLQIMTPWTWAIAYRRFQQGVLIRFNDPRAVVLGTLVRLAANSAVLATGYLVGGISGIAVGCAGIAAGVLAEAAYAGLRVQPIVRGALRNAPPQDRLTRGTFLRFYVPLALTPLMGLLVQPIGAAAMNRMPNAILSVAAWTPVHAVVFLVRAPGFAFNEVVVALSAEPGGRAALRKAATLAGLTLSSTLTVFAVTPLAPWFYAEVLGLGGRLLELAVAATPFAALMPGYTVLLNWLQGRLVHEHRTTAITEAIAIYLAIASVGLGIGVFALDFMGIYVALCSFTLAGLSQTAWLAYRARQVS